MAGIVVELASYFSNFVLMMDHWVVVVTALTLAYLLINFRQFTNKEVAVTYILFMSLFVFWSLRNISTLYFDRTPAGFQAFSLVLDLGVMAFSGYLFYQYWRERDVRALLSKLELEASTEEELQEVEYEGAVGDQYDVESGFMYLILESGTAYSYNLFRQAVTDVRGICFSRKHPAKVQRRYRLEETPIFWFTERDDAEADTIEPFRLNFLREIIMEFIEQNKEEEEGSVILIDGTEYLLHKNPFEKFLEFVEHLIDDISDTESITLILSIDEDSMSERNLAYLREEFDEIRQVVLEEEKVKKLHY
jgi:hypothetical protein